MEQNKIIIKINYPFINLELRKEAKKIDEIIWRDDKCLSLSLLHNIDNLIKRNKMKKNDISTVEAELSQKIFSYSSSRIAKIISLLASFYLTKLSGYIKMPSKF